MHYSGILLYLHKLVLSYSTAILNYVFRIQVFSLEKLNLLL